MSEQDRAALVALLEEAQDIVTAVAGRMSQVSASEFVHYAMNIQRKLAAYLAALAAAPAGEPVGEPDGYDALRKLDPDWGYGGEPVISPRAIESAIAFEREPSRVPCMHGGVQLEWHRFGLDLEVEFGPDGKLLGVLIAKDGRDESHELSWLEPVGEPEPSEAPACDDCKDTGIRVNSEGRDAYCHCTASPRPTPQPSAPAISMPADRSAIIAKAIEADDSCISAGAPAAVLPRCPISLCNRTMVCPRHGDVTRAEASMAMNEQLAAVLPEPCHNCAGSDPVSLTWMCAECLTAMADVLLEPVDVEALARETAEQVSWCVVDDKPARERVILAALRRVQPAAVRQEPT
jgi:hypothetical protein